LNEEQKLDVLNIAIVEVVSDIMDKVDVLSEATLQRAKNLLN
jgi:chromatin segregation and condensation protein Rec8/ScpA/Scc1 (kleisin family)